MSRFTLILRSLPPPYAARLQGMSPEEIGKILRVGIDAADVAGGLGPPPPKEKTIKLRVPRKKNSANLGICGENFFEEVVACLGEYSISNTAQQGKKGDFIVESNALRVLVDVKNYNCSVPTKEVEKLHRDLQCNPSAGAGMLLSIGSKITGRGSFAIEYTIVGNKRVPILLVRANTPILIQEYVKFIFRLVEVRDHQRICEDGVDLAREHIRDIQVQVDVMSQITHNLQSMKADINRVVDRSVLGIIMCENRIREKLDQVTRAIAECDEYKEIDGELTLDAILSGPAKQAPESAVETFKKIWASDWVGRTITKGIVTLTHADADMRVKFLKTTVNAVVTTRDCSINVKIDENCLAVLRALDVI